MEVPERAHDECADDARQSIIDAFSAQQTGVHQPVSTIPGGAPLQTAAPPAQKKPQLLIALLACVVALVMGGFAYSQYRANESLRYAQLAQLSEELTLSGQSEDPQDSTETASDQESSEKSKTPKKTIEELYEPVLTQYRAGTGAYVNPEYNAYYGNPGEVYYAFQDLDGNGVPELIVGQLIEGVINAQHGVFSLEGETPVDVFANVNLYGYRHYLNIYPRNVIVVYCIDGDAEHAWAFYEISKTGTTVDHIKTYYESGVEYSLQDSSGVREIAPIMFERSISADISQSPNDLSDAISFDWKKL